MKTTVEIPDALFKEVKRLSTRKGVPLRELVELGLRQVVEREARQTKPFRLKKSHFKGTGPMKEGMAWDEIRNTIYQGRGA